MITNDYRSMSECKVAWGDGHFPFCNIFPKCKYFDAQFAVAHSIAATSTRPLPAGLTLLSNVLSTAGSLHKRMCNQKGREKDLEEVFYNCL